jgi:hypothetical protein
MKDKGSVTTGILATILGLLLVVGIAVGGYKLNWWLVNDTTNRTAQVNQNSYGRQVGLVDDIVRKYAEVQNPNLPDNQKQAITTEMCVSFAMLSGSVPLPYNISNYLNTECI